MSIHGGVRMEMTLLSYKWERMIDNDSDRLHPGWHFVLTLGPMDLRIDTVPNRRYFRLYKWGCALGGYDVDFSRNYETPKKYVFGDASERLLK
jgi:hypothetical protein